MTSSRKRQRTLFEFASSSPSTKHSVKGRSTFSSSEDCNSDPGKIQFEQASSDEEDDHSRHPSPAGDNEDIRPRRYATRKQKLQSSPVIYVESEEEEELTHKPAFSSIKQSHHRVVVSDESDSQQLRRKPRLVKGRRPGESPLDDEDDENLIDEVDEDMILNSRLRDRSKKSAYAKNLERLQRRRRGHAVISESEEEASEDSGSDSGRPVQSKVIPGARQTITIIDDDESLDEDLSEQDENEFIVEDDGAEDIPELPTMFSMGTFQDLSHHFKIICQLFVHLAVKEPHRQHSFMERALKQDYFSVPLAITRRKLSGMRDSLVTSSIWKPDFKAPLETFPSFRLEHLDFSIPRCDACHLGNRVATLRGIVSGHAYDSLTYEPRYHDDTDGEGDTIADWNLGRFCAARAQVFHAFTHWEFFIDDHKHILYHILRKEVDNLKEATQLSGERVFVPATKGPALPEELDDADAMMDWLDGRGIINEQWTWIKNMMDRAHNLENKGRVAEDDVELAMG